jgi:serine/threonine protein kinase
MVYHVVHGDFGPHNVMVNNANQVKIIDIGSVASIEYDTEINTREGLTPQLDMIGAGKIIKTLYPEYNSNALIKGAVASCLNRVPRSRISARDLLAMVDNAHWPV